MSYILEALKKSEQERELGKVPTLKNAPQGVPDTNRRVTVWLLCVGVFIISLVSVYFYFNLQYSPIESPPASPYVERSDVVSIVGEDRLVEREGSKTSLIKPQVDIEDIEKADIAQKDKWLSSRAVPVQTDENVSETLVEEGKRQIAVADPEANSPGAAIIPLLDALPLTTRQRIPELSLDVHVYASEPSERFILLNMRRYAEGQQTREGLVVEEVISDGVVFSFQGTLFRLKN